MTNVYQSKWYAGARRLITDAVRVIKSFRVIIRVARDSSCYVTEWTMTYVISRDMIAASSKGEYDPCLGMIAINGTRDEWTHVIRKCTERVQT